MIAHEMSTALLPTSDRGKWQAIRRGFSMHCPNCGKGALFRSYLKVNDCCPVCGEELFHQRADDAPPYITILVVGHVVVAGMIAMEEWNNTIPIWIHAIIWPLVTIVLSLALLPRFKGALIGFQWALRMHGFETALPSSRSLPHQP